MRSSRLIDWILKIPIRAAQNKQRGRMRPAGRQFDMPALEGQVLVEWPFNTAQVSISSTFYALLFLTEMLCAAFL